MVKDIAEQVGLHEKIEAVLGLVKEASAKIMSVRAAGFQVDRKADKSPVTIADTEAEKIILAGLRALTPSVAVIAEEDVAAGHKETLTETFWLVDPLDGTREFAAGRAEFTVNVALIHKNRVVAGVVSAPALGEFFIGFVGQNGGRGQAFKIDESGQRQEIRVRKQPSAGIKVFASRHYKDDPTLPEFLKDYQVTEVVDIGSSLKFCRLAEGEGDLYPRFGRTMEWDTAAAQAVLEAAGGSVCDFNGKPLLYGKRDFENPPFICFGAREK